MSLSLCSLLHSPSLCLYLALSIFLCVAVSLPLSSMKHPVLERRAFMTSTLQLWRRIDATRTPPQRRRSCSDVLATNRTSKTVMKPLPSTSNGAFPQENGNFEQLQVHYYWWSSPSIINHNGCCRIAFIFLLPFAWFFPPLHVLRSFFL